MSELKSVEELKARLLTKISKHYYHYIKEQCDLAESKEARAAGCKCP